MHLTIQSMIYALRKEIIKNWLNLFQNIKVYAPKDALVRKSQI